MLSIGGVSLKKVLGADWVEGEDIHAIIQHLVEIKGVAFTSSDNLHEIMQGVGMVSGAALVPRVIIEDTTLSDDGAYLSLDIINSAKLTAIGKKITVIGDFRIFSARIEAAELVVYGNLTVQRAPTDTSYTNLLDVDRLTVHGDVVIKNTEWLPGHLATDVQKIGGNLTFDGITRFHTGSGGFDEGNGSSASSTRAVTIHVKGDVSSDLAVFNGYAKELTGGGMQSNQDNDGYVGLGFRVFCDGNISMPSLTSIDCRGGNITGGTGAYVESGGGGGKIVLSAGGNITVGTGLVMDARGGNATDGDGDYGGDANDIDFYYAGSLTGSISNAYVAGGTGPVSAGADGNYANVNAIGAGHLPETPVQTTPVDAETGQLEWDVPGDANGSNLDFRVEVHEKLSNVAWLAVMDQNSNDDAGQFSGTPPYAESTGSVTYTIPAGLASGAAYRWRVTAMKDTDTTLSGIPSAWREFIME